MTCYFFNNLVLKILIEEDYVTIIIIENKIIKQESGNIHVKWGNMHAIEWDNVRANLRETVIGDRSALMTLSIP